MKEKNKTYLILVRGRWIVQSIPSSHISTLSMSNPDSYWYHRQLYHTLVHYSLGDLLNISKGHLKMLFIINLFQSLHTIQLCLISQVCVLQLGQVLNTFMFASFTWEYLWLRP